MIYKVLYQPNMKQTPRRETTQSLYMEANSEVEAREIIRKNHDYNIEFIEPLEGNHLVVR